MSLGSAGSTGVTAPTSVRPGSVPPAGDVANFGATDIAWAARHTLDPAYGSGFAYDREASLPRTNGQTGDRYSVVDHQYGRVLGYTLNLLPTPIGAAGARAKDELPSDARVRWTRTLPTCRQTEFTSGILAQALGPKPIGDVNGDVFASFYTVLSDGSTAFVSTGVNEVIFQLGSYPTPANAPAC